MIRRSSLTSGSDIRAAVDRVVEAFAQDIAALDERLVAFNARWEELCARANLAGEPLTEPSLPRLSGFRREPVATLARFEGPEQ